MSFYNSFGTPVAIVHPFNTYGPRQSARAVIPIVITKIAAGSKKIQLGSIYPTRDFNFVEDAVSGFISAILFRIDSIAIFFFSTQFCKESLA